MSTKKPLFTQAKKKRTTTQTLMGQSEWKILIADDEPEVHDVTKLALRKFKFKGNGLRFLSAYSGQEAKQLLLEHPDTAIVLVDVVMEEDDAGLKFIKAIRDELKNQMVRIILRTGQPGQAPQKEVILDYDINDYKLKTELTAQKLFVTIVTALRSYYDLMLVEVNRKELAKTYANLEKEIAERRHTQQELQQHNEYLAALHETTLAIINRLDTSDLLESIVARATALMGTPHGHITLVEPDGSVMITRFGVGLFAQRIGDRLKPGNGVAGKVWQSGQPLAINEYRIVPNRVAGSDLDKVRAFVGVPLKSQLDFMGVLGAARVEEDKPFTETEIAHLAQFAELAALALDNAKLYTAAQQELIEREQAEMALQASEERFRVTFEQAAVGIAQLGLDRRWLWFNRTMGDIVGYPSEELLEKTSDDITHPEDLETNSAYVDQLLAGKIQTHAREKRYIRKDGSLVWINRTVSLVRELSGEPEYFVVVVEDISQRKQLEQQIQESLERRERQVQTSTQIAQEITAAPALNELFRQVVSLVQARFEYYHTHLYILEEDNLVVQAGTGQAGRQMQEEGHKIALTAEKSLVARTVRSGEPVLIPDVSQEPEWLPNSLLPDTKAEIAVPIKLGDNILGVLDVQSNTVNGLSEEDQILLLGLCGQIAVAINNRRGQEALRASEERYRSLIGVLPDPFVLYGEKGIVTYLNSAFTETFGWTEAELLGQRLKFVPEKNKAETQEALQRAFKGEKVVFESERFTKDGRILKVIVGGSSFTDEDGQPMGIVSILRDITEQKQMEEGIRISEAKFRTLYESTGDAVMILNEKGFIDCNEATLEIFGYDSQKQFLNTHPGEQSPPTQPGGRDSRIVADENIAVAMKDGSHRFEWMHRRADGSVFPAEVLLTAMKLEGKQVLQAVVRDITKRKHAENILTQSAAERAAFNEVSLAIVAQPTLSSIYQIATQALVEHFNMSFARIWVFEEATNELVLQASAGEFTHLDGAHGRVSLDSQRKLAWIANRRKPHISNDLFNDPRMDNKRWVRESNTVAFAGYPLIADDELLGVLGMFSHEPISEETLPLLQSFAVLIGTVTNNKRLLQQSQQAEALLRKRVEELNCMTDIGREIAESPPIPDLLEEVTKRIPAAMQYPEECESAILYDDQIYGMSEAVDKPCQIVNALRIEGQVMGRIYISYHEKHEFLNEESALLGGIANRVGGYIESSRLSEQTQQALAQTEALYKGSDRVIRGTSPGEILQALVYSTALQRLDQANIMFFNHIWEDKRPETLILETVWRASDDSLHLSVGTKYPLDHLPSVKHVSRDQPTIIHDLTTDERMDSDIFSIMVEQLNMRGIAIFPLVTRDQWIGLVAGHTYDILELGDEEIRQISSLVDQAAIVIQNQRLFAQAQARAEQERRVRVITNKIRQGTNPSAILQTAREEISQLLGTSKSVAQLGTQKKLLSKLKQQSKQNGNI